jgi:hypothetical protein
MFKKAEKKKVKLKIALFWPSGSGKTRSALKMAYWMCWDWSKIWVLDTENGSASLYSDLWHYLTMEMKAPFSPVKYINSIKAAKEAWLEILIIDSISHEWNWEGGILDMKEQMTGNDFTKRAKLTVEHNKFLQAILQSDLTIIMTARSKQEYVMQQGEGWRMVVEKMGMAAVQRDWLDYEVTIAFNLDQKHNAEATKDRTGLFRNKLPEQITEEHGKILAERASNGVEKTLTEKETLEEKLKEQIEVLNKAYFEWTKQTELVDKISKSLKLLPNEKEYLLWHISILFEGLPLE